MNLPEITGRHLFADDYPFMTFHPDNGWEIWQSQSSSDNELLRDAGYRVFAMPKAPPKKKAEK